MNNCEGLIKLFLLNIANFSLAIDTSKPNIIIFRLIAHNTSVQEPITIKWAPGLYEEYNSLERITLFVRRLKPVC